MVTLNASPNDQGQWGPNILGVDALAGGQYAEIPFQTGEGQCLWDIRATYDNGGTEQVYNFNHCEVATVTLTGPD